MLTSKRCIVVVLCVMAFGVVAGQAQQPAINLITAEELKTKLTNNEPVVIVDVRSAEGFANSATTVSTSSLPSSTTSSANAIAPTRSTTTTQAVTTTHAS